MTSEEKLNLVIKAIVEAKKLARKGQDTIIYLNSANGLENLNPKEIYKILSKLKDEEKIFSIHETPSSALHYSLSGLPGNIDYFSLEINEIFDSWYESYLMRQKTGLENIDYINMLRIYDVVLDINEQVQLTNKTTVTIHLLPPLIRFSVLFPADSIGFRDKYCETRWDSLKYLKEKGVISDFKHNEGLHRWQTTVTVSLKLNGFDDFYKKIQDEYVKRNKSDKKTEKPKTEILKIDPKKVTAKVSYNAQKGELDIEDKKVKFKKESFRAKLLELLLKDDKSRKKEWSWDEVIDKIQGTEGSPDLQKENKKKFYPACDGLSKFIAQKTGINDLLIFNKSTVQINPKYL